MPTTSNYPIQSRDEFRRLVQETAAKLAPLAASMPNYPPFVSIAQQLEAMLEWTEADRSPTMSQRDSINIGLLTARELDDDQDPHIQDLCNRFHAIHAYWKRIPPI